MLDNRVCGRTADYSGTEGCLTVLYNPVDILVVR